MDKNTSHLAGEFLVAGELSRQGLSVSITFGNAKSVDIFAENHRRVYKIDAKAIRSKSNWPLKLSGIEKDIVYVFVYLGNRHDMMFKKPVEYFIASGHEIVRDKLITEWNSGRSGVMYSTVKGTAYEARWSAFSGAPLWPTGELKRLGGKKR